MASDLDQYLGSLRKSRYRLEFTGRNHIAIYDPTGNWLANAPHTSCSRRGLDNLKSAVRRAERTLTQKETSHGNLR